MNDGTETTEKAYWTREVADILDIKEGTVRKYARLMEKHGYDFSRNDQDHRGFIESDVITMKQIQEMAKGRSMTLETAVKAIMTAHPQDRNDSVTPSVTEGTERYETRHNELKEYMETIINDNQELKSDNQELKSTLKELISRMDQQQNYIDNSLAKRDERLMQTLNEIQEQKRLAASDNEQTEGNPKKKGIFARLFGK